jgi:predicted enzyme related to lactoylglutathione lyase
MEDIKPVSFSLIVIRSTNMGAAIAFYGAVGLRFDEEQHGIGPVHFSCDLGGVALEIYPGQDGTTFDSKAGGATMLGFVVESLDEVLADLKGLGVEPKSPPKDAAWGRWVNVTDPDGRVVQLNQPAS